MLLDRAARTPNPERYLSRVSSFKRKIQAEYGCKKMRFDKSLLDDTPRKLPWNPIEITNLASTSAYSPIIEHLKTYASTGGIRESLHGNVLIGEARKLSPVKRRRVFVSKRYTKSSIVRRTVRERKRRHSRFGCCRRMRKSYDWLGSLPSESVSLPSPSLIRYGTVCRGPNSPCASDTSPEISKSTDTVATRLRRTIASPLRLIRAKHFEDIARSRDENQNDLSVWCTTSRLPVLKSPLIKSKNGSSPTTGLGSRTSNDLDASQRSEFAEAITNKCDDTSNLSINGQTLSIRAKNRKKIWKFW